MEGEYDKDENSYRKPLVVTRRRRLTFSSMASMIAVSLFVIISTVGRRHDDRDGMMALLGQGTPSVLLNSTGESIAQTTSRYDHGSPNPSVFASTVAHTDDGKSHRSPSILMESMQDRDSVQDLVEERETVGTVVRSENNNDDIRSYTQYDRDSQLRRHHRRRGERDLSREDRRRRAGGRGHRRRGYRDGDDEDDDHANRRRRGGLHRESLLQSVDDGAESTVRREDVGGGRSEIMADAYSQTQADDLTTVRSSSAFPRAKWADEIDIDEANALIDENTEGWTKVEGIETIFNKKTGSTLPYMRKGRGRFCCDPKTGEARPGSLFRHRIKFAQNQKWEKYYWTDMEHKYAQDLGDREKAELVRTVREKMSATADGKRKIDGLTNQQILSMITMGAGGANAAPSGLVDAHKVTAGDDSEVLAFPSELAGENKAEIDKSIEQRLAQASISGGAASVTRDEEEDSKSKVS
mmetsp:Transcript_21625/g.34921  ORF Transcript_21625/g.34921 Transcript_21625/m.34921 type:complete len:467 (+) Transcript_21625:68-1468(+)